MEKQEEKSKQNRQIITKRNKTENATTMHKTTSDLLETSWHATAIVWPGLSSTSQDRSQCLNPHADSFLLLNMTLFCSLLRLLPLLLLSPQLNLIKILVRKQNHGAGVAFMNDCVLFMITQTSVYLCRRYLFIQACIVQQPFMLFLPCFYGI